MNDFSEIENELRKLRPARPSPILFERVEKGLLDRTASAAEDSSRIIPWPWRFTATPYKIGFALAAAALLLLLAWISTDQNQQRDGKEIAQISPEHETAPVLNRAQESTSPEKFVPAGATRLIYNTRDEGLQFARGSGQPLRRWHYQTHETWQWRNPRTGASLRVSYPSEEVVLIPVSGQ